MKELGRDKYLRRGLFSLLRDAENSGDSVLYFRYCNSIPFENLEMMKEFGLFRESWYKIGESFDSFKYVKDKSLIREVEYEKFG